jgi:formiminoglutamase
MDEFMDDPDLCYSYYEDIFVREKLSFYEAVNFAMARTGRPAGLEIDMRCINGSRAIPCGIEPLLARQFITWCTKEMNPLYLHIAEGVAGEGNISPQQAAYFITDFIKACKKK